MNNLVVTKIVKNENIVKNDKLGTRLLNVLKINIVFNDFSTSLSMKSNKSLNLINLSI